MLYVENIHVFLPGYKVPVLSESTPVLADILQILQGHGQCDSYPFGQNCACVFRGPPHVEAGSGVFNGFSLLIPP